MLCSLFSQVCSCIYHYSKLHPIINGLRTSCRHDMELGLAEVSASMRSLHRTFLHTPRTAIQRRTFYRSLIHIKSTPTLKRIDPSNAVLTEGQVRPCLLLLLIWTANIARIGYHHDRLHNAGQRQEVAHQVRPQDRADLRGTDPRSIHYSRRPTMCSITIFPS